MKKAALSVMAFLLASCGPHVDTSSPQAYSDSIAKVNASLSSEKRTELHHALAVLALGADDSNGGIFANAPITSPIFLAAGVKIKGQSGEDIIELGRKEERSLLTKAIADDSAQVATTKAERGKFANVFDSLRIQSANYSARPDMIGQREPEIKFTLVNGSKVPLKSISLEGKLTSPGRSVPWVVAPISYAIPGGIEPGETKSFDLAPNMFGDWKGSDEFAQRKDLVLTLTVENAEGADGTPFLKSDAADLQKVIEDMAEKQRRLNLLTGAAA